MQLLFPLVLWVSFLRAVLVCTGRCSVLIFLPSGSLPRNRTCPYIPRCSLLLSLVLRSWHFLQSWWPFALGCFDSCFSLSLSFCTTKKVARRDYLMLLLVVWLQFLEILVIVLAKLSPCWYTHCQSLLLGIFAWAPPSCARVATQPTFKIVSEHEAMQV